MMNVYNKAILPKDFKANGIYCGLKKSKKLDLALFCSELQAKASALFTSNAIKAAPVQLSRKYLKNNKIFKAIIVNSGNANCFTGKPGLRDAEDTAKSLANALKVKKENILVSSTGIIGKRLDINKIKKAIPELVCGLSDKGINKAANAILTTDKFAKAITVKFKMDKSEITICGVAKGAGMIAPNMATMLVFILTDANITQRALDKALKISTEKSFNCITVDGCMSTNDSVNVLANGQAGNTLIDLNKNFSSFVSSLGVVCNELAKMIVKDAEGASKFIQIKVEKAKSFKEARAIALSIANSNLFKTAVYGENPNFGRIVASAGAAGIDIKEKYIRIRVSPLNRKDINVNVSINRGSAKATVYTSDLTPEYIKINAEYN